MDNCHYRLLSKWIEAKALSSKTKFQVMKFLKSRIVSRHQVPQTLDSDNKPQLTRRDIKRLLEELNIEHRFTYVRHTQMNSQVDTVNKMVRDGLKK